MKRRIVPVVVLVAAVVSLPGCGSDDGDDPRPASSASTAGSSAEVTIEAFNFSPDPLTVDAGTTITFVNRDAIDHTVTAGTRDKPQPGEFDGVLPQEGATFELTLDEPGTYRYFCRIHTGPGMTATITVQ